MSFGLNVESKAFSCCVAAETKNSCMVLQSYKAVGFLLGRKDLLHEFQLKRHTVLWFYCYIFITSEKV